jgi:hypothetical protein
MLDRKPHIFNSLKVSSYENSIQVENNMERIHLVKENKAISNQFQDLMSQPHFGLSVRVKPTLTKVGT